MLDNVLSFFGFGEGTPATEEVGIKRKHVRLDGRGVRIGIGKNIYPVHDWNISGISFHTTPEDYVKLKETVTMRIGFPFLPETVYVEQEAVICRCAHRGVSAAVFTAMEPATRRQFERVIDNYHAQGFLRSQQVA